MKKLYIFTFIAVIITINLFSQNGVTGYTTTIAGASPTTNNMTKRSAFVIDNNGNKWIGFNAGTTASFQLIRFNGTQWDTFSVFNHILVNNKVNVLAVDAANNVWIGSNAGLTVYNGTSFTTYNTSNSSIVSNTVTALSCANGIVYAGTYKGLAVFNGTTFTNYNKAINGMKSDTVTCITAENLTTVWIGNNFGLDKFNGSNFTFTYLTPANAKDTVNCIYIDAQSNKWIGTNRNGVLKYNNSNFYSMEQLFPLSVLQDSLYLGNWPITVKNICKGFNGGIFFGIGQLPSAVPYGPTFGSVEIINNQVQVYSSLYIGYYSYSHVYDIAQYDIVTNKIFYISMVGGGLYVPFLFSYDGSQPLAQPPFDGTTSYNSAFLDINNTNALITDNSLLHYGDHTGQSKYFAPKQNNTSPLYASSMWIGGYQNGTDLRIAAMTYRQNGYDFWPGPLDGTNGAASIDTATALAYDKVWKVNRFDIANFIYNWNAGNVQNGTYFPPASIITWPGNSPYVGQTLAPFVDINNDGVYNYMQGDYPLIKGDQMIWSVYNDALGKHSETGSLHNMGIEVHASSYAFTCPNIADSNITLNTTTFYNYKIFNRSLTPVTQTHIGLWMDTDLGNYQDDYIGCDVTNDFGYTYNGDGYDEDISNTKGYHHNLPVFACNILSGPIADAVDGIDNNHNCVIDEAGERCMMGGFTYYNNINGNTVNGNPSGASAYYNLIRSYWESGNQPMTYGSFGTNPHSASNPICNYLFPGNTDPYGYGLGGSCSNPIAAPTTLPWSEGNVTGNHPGDRRFIVNVGPFTMQAGGMSELDYALVFTQDSANCDTNNTCLIARATQDNQRVKHWFNTNTFPSCLSLVGVGIKKNATPQLNLKLYPNPANTNVYVEFGAAQKNVTIEVIDMLGGVVRGYQYAELDKYATLPVSDLQSGVYMVKIKSDEGFAITKFVKE